jgi:hypothetical protein
MLSSIVFKFSLLLEKEAKWGEFGLPDMLKNETFLAS